MHCSCTDREGGERIRLSRAFDDREEAQLVVREILSNARDHGRRFGEFAILYRTNAQSRPFEEALMAHDVPYAVVGGVRFYGRAEVKDALAYLRLLLNPADGMALKRIINVPARGIGKTTIERAEALAAAQGTTLLGEMRATANSAEAGRSGARVRAFLELYATLRDEVSLSPVEAIARTLDRTAICERSKRSDA